MISEDEWKVLNALYASWLNAVRKATEIDPDHVRAWTRVAQAATFAGREKLAHQSLQKALSLDSGFVEALTWGLEIYQPKWFNKPDGLAKAAEMSVDAANNLTLSAESALRASGMTEEASALLKRSIDRMRERLKNHRTDSYAYYDLAYILLNEKQFGEATKVARDLVKLDPDMVMAHYILGKALLQTGHYADAAPELKLLVDGAPGHTEYCADLGPALVNYGKGVDAKTQLNTVISLVPNTPTADDARRSLAKLGR